MADERGRGYRKPFPEVDERQPERRTKTLNRALEESFRRVREDIQQIKRALNDQAEEISDLHAKVEGFVNMYEFFEYMQHIDSQMEIFKRDFMKKEHFEEHQKELRERMKAMDSLLESDRRLKEELAALKSSSRGQAPDPGNLAHVYEEITKLDADILDLKKSLNRQRRLEFAITNKLGGVEQLADNLKQMEEELERNAHHIAEMQKRIRKERKQVTEDVEKLKKESRVEPGRTENSEQK